MFRKNSHKDFFEHQEKVNLCRHDNNKFSRKSSKKTPAQLPALINHHEKKIAHHQQELQHHTVQLNKLRLLLMPQRLLSQRVTSQLSLEMQLLLMMALESTKPQQSNEKDPPQETQVNSDPSPLNRTPFS